jgi:hypothetical protein
MRRRSSGIAVVNRNRSASTRESVDRDDTPLARLHHDRRSFVAIVGLMRIASGPWLAPIRSILPQNPRVAGSPALWSYVAYKSGSEPGVYAGVWYLVRSDGRVFVFSFGSTTLATRSISWPPWRRRLTRWSCSPKCTDTRLAQRKATALRRTAELTPQRRLHRPSRGLLASPRTDARSNVPRAESYSSFGLLPRLASFRFVVKRCARGAGPVDSRTTSSAETRC